MANPGTRRFLVEAYEPRGRGAGALAEIEMRARIAATELSRSGAVVRYLRAILVPEDETCFYVFEASSRDAVTEAARRAGLASGRINEAFESLPEPNRRVGPEIT